MMMGRSWGGRTHRTVALALLLLMALAASLLTIPTVQAAVDVYEFETVEQEQRFRELSNEFRCPMCQNANLSSSPGGVAADLRREIYRMIMEGQTDRQIEEFMLARYGDFILYRPRLTWQTVILWFGPALFLLIGIWFAYSIMRRSGGGSPTKTNELDADEKARLDKLLAGRDHGTSDKT